MHLACGVYYVFDNLLANKDYNKKYVVLFLSLKDSIFVTKWNETIKYYETTFFYVLYEHYDFLGRQCNRFS